MHPPPAWAHPGMPGTCLRCQAQVGPAGGRLRPQRASGAQPEALWPEGREAEDQRRSPALSPQSLRPFHLNSGQRRPSLHSRPCARSLEGASPAALSLPVPIRALAGRHRGSRGPGPLSSLSQQLPSKLEMCLAPPAESSPEHVYFHLCNKLGSGT